MILRLAVEDVFLSKEDVADELDPQALARGFVPPSQVPLALSKGRFPSLKTYVDPDAWFGQVLLPGDALSLTHVPGRPAGYIHSHKPI